MGLMAWFKSLAAGKAEENPATVAPSAGPVAATATSAAAAKEEDGVVAGLNFKTAIDAHMKWKIRLQQYVQGQSEEDLKVEAVSRDDQCLLGKWIQSVGSERFGGLREFQEMKMEHARFHLCAGDVLACAQAGDGEGAMQKLHSGDYVRASERVKLHLARLYVQVSQGH